MPKYLMMLLLSHFHFPLVSSNLTPTLAPTVEPWLCSAGVTHWCPLLHCVTTCHAPVTPLSRVTCHDSPHSQQGPILVSPELWVLVLVRMCPHVACLYPSLASLSARMRPPSDWGCRGPLRPLVSAHSARGAGATTGGWLRHWGRPRRPRPLVTLDTHRKIIWVKSTNNYFDLLYYFNLNAVELVQMIELDSFRPDSVYFKPKNVFPWYYNSKLSAEYFEIIFRIILSSEKEGIILLRSSIWPRIEDETIQNWISLL